MEISDTYQGREHSLIKHELLRGYLEVLLAIVGISGVKEFTYVDCFAGPWGDESESLSGTSIAISLEILSKVKKMLSDSRHVRDTKFRAIYVEENIKSHAKLAEYLKKHSPEGIECIAIHGDYAKKQDEILHLCGEKSFSFFFIDPKGWLDVGIPKLSKLLSRPRSEFLITFMYDFLNRAIGMSNFRPQVSQMLGNLSEQDYLEMESLPAPERANWVVRKYREQLKTPMSINGGRPRSYHADILHKDKDRVHYHMVYLTSHHKGVVKFAEASERVDVLQKILRVQKKLDASSQFSLFSAEEQVEHHKSERSSLEDVKAYWLRKLDLLPIRYDEQTLATMLEETGWLIRDFQDAFRELNKDNKVENLDGSTRRTKHPIHFGKGERLRKLV